MTVTDWLASPLPEQLKVKVLVLLNGPVDWESLVAFAPDQAPDAVQAVALLDDQVSIEVLPLATLVGFALNARVGAGALTVTVADRLTVPLVPLQLRLNVLVLVSAPVDWLPDVALVPDHAPDAVQDVASVDDQLRLEAVPALTAAGLAVNTIVWTARGEEIWFGLSLASSALWPEPQPASAPTKSDAARNNARGLQPRAARLQRNKSYPFL